MGPGWREVEEEMAEVAAWPQLSSGGARTPRPAHLVKDSLWKSRNSEVVHVGSSSSLSSHHNSQACHSTTFVKSVDGELTHMCHLLQPPDSP